MADTRRAAISLGAYALGLTTFADWPVELRAVIVAAALLALLWGQRDSEEDRRG